jgi:hypothetical protein
MKKVFIGGSRRISKLSADVRRRIDRAIERQSCVLVGDANGADKAVQAYLNERAYPNVVVFCTGGQCRNNLAGWQVKAVTPPHGVRDFEFFTAKDAAMARDADAALMLWDGKSSGTVVNVARMIAAGKPAVVYVGPERRFRTLRTSSDLESLLALCPPDAKRRIDRHIAEHAAEYRQPAIFELPPTR